MGRRRALLIVTACGGLAIAFALLLRHDNEPHYNGRSLSAWLRVYREWSKGQRGEPDFDEANHAIWAIGTNAIPFLLKWIQQEPPSWHRAAHTKLSGPSDNALAKLLVDGPGYDKAEAAMLAFGVLGTNAALAIPSLVALMNATNHPATADRATAALSGLGGPALPRLLATLAIRIKPFCRL